MDAEKIRLGAACFGKIVTWEACLTRNNLQKWGYAVSSRYHLCEEDLESVEKLFLRCRFSRECCVINVSWVIPLKIKSLMEFWQRQWMPRNMRQIWRTIPTCIFLELRMFLNLLGGVT